MFNVNKERLISMFNDLVKIPSPSWQEEGVMKYIINVLKNINVEYEKFPLEESCNLYARLRGDRSKNTIMFESHMDTVIPCDNINTIITDTKISSDGTTILGADDKAAIASFLEALYCLKEGGIPHGDIEFLFTCAEEVGLQGIKGFDLSKINAKYTFVFDSEGKIGRIVLKAPYHSTIDIAIKGRASHAGMAPEKGINAIRVLSEIIYRIPYGRVDEETTTNVGIISGGEAVNIVAERAECRLEARSLSKKKLRLVESEIINIIKEVSKTHGAKAEISKKMEYSGFSIKEDDPIIKIVNIAVSKIGLKPEYITSGGGSDANVINKSGIKAVNLSVGMQNAHTKDEYILKKDLVKSAELVLSIIDSV
ncbi:MAG: M20/M25/M40 family metallo-hydrolase [Spirochaetota bacterium]|nr:M20/M25/M40 family metallo-hydrolase [Spirochaetota bacterium]